jgi:ABC-2 type transport system permease protein
MRWFFVFVQIGIFGLAVSRLIVAMPDYYHYYAMGVIVMTMYSVAIFTGYEIYDEADDGFVEYLLSIPITRRELVIGRSLAGGLRSFLFMSPIVAVFLLLMGVLNPVKVLTALVALYGFAFGITGLSITLAVGLRAGDRFDIVMGALDALIVRLSSALYPQAFMPGPIAFLSSLNPLTYATDLFRWSLNYDVKYLSNPVVALLVLLLFLMTFNFLGVVIYERRLEGGTWR